MHCVGGDDAVGEGQRTRQKLPIPGIVVIEELDDARSPRIRIADMTQMGLIADTLTGGDENDVARGQIPGRQPFGCEERSTDPRAACPIGISLDAELRSALLRPIDRRQHPIDVPTRGAVDMAVVGLTAEFHRGPRRLLGAVERSRRIGLDDLTHMGERRHPGPGREFIHRQVLPRIRPRCVPLKNADTQRSGLQLRLQQPEPLGKLNGAGICLPVRIGEHGQTAD